MAREPDQKRYRHGKSKCELRGPVRMAKQTRRALAPPSDPTLYR